MKFTWTTFTGIRPKVDPQLLPDGNAQVAENVNTERGGLRPIPGVKHILDLEKSGIKTIYRFGQAVSSAVNYWFTWDKYVDVAKGPIHDDTEERTYWTGDGAPKYTTAAIGTSGSDLPSAWRPLGVTAPVTGPTFTAIDDVTPPAANAGTESRVYVYTFVTDNSEESAPSPPVTGELLIGQGVRLSAMETAATNGAVLTHKRIYRAQRGVYLFVAEIPITDTTYDDFVPSDLLGEVCPSTNWELPPANLSGLIAGPNGMMAGFVGYTVQFCVPYHPHSWPDVFKQTVGFPVVGLGQFGQSFVALTTGVPFVIQGSHPSSMTVTETKFYHPCVSKQSIVSTGGDVIWASPDGLVSIGVSNEQNHTAMIFTPTQWRALGPETIIGSWHEGWYIGSYVKGAGRQAFMFSPGAQEWIDLPTIAATAMFRDTVGDTLYMSIADKLYAFREGGDMTYTWKSQKLTTPLTDFVSVRVTGEYPVEFKLFKDEVLKFTKNVSSDDPFRIPSGLARHWEIQLSGTKKVLGCAISSTEADL